ncbi:transposase domain-containing protein [Stenotrophomonas maltophilia]|uniref:transposase domain-containing protein n=1 Tax=Stenotrophomonas maltophilia TaxID=40324 RepID=UPI00066A3F3E|nr:transposase domain-containing protein [Stenotrophomonas maltophilia]MBH1465358.1 Mu transposase C-terminal domain-containing protein [Stenotrophomonas maltophilia]MBH1613046.1 Mu transposase C-terminal domain-containing protein [Stenotrophomonas maltophilia]MBN5167254.1 Mu transposase C-terminal domain-containing protein [Stenotrophomonas maltophilia]
MADGSVPNRGRIDLASLASALGKSKRAIEIRANREKWPFESRTVRGGQQRIFAVSSLPVEMQAAVALATQATAPVAAPTTARQSSADRIASAWKRYEAVPQHLKDEAHRRLRALQAVDQLVADGRSVMDARALVAAQLQRENVGGASVASLGRWAALVAKVEKHHRLAMLVPAYTGRTARVEIPAEAWDLFKADYLRVEAPTASSCYDRLQRIAAIKPEWPALPCLKTFQRRIDAELPRAVLVLARQGQEKFDQTFPTQERDRSVFHALEAVNSDGHKFDVFAKWPDGTVARPIMVGVQDLYSGKLLGYRIAETESADLARFAFRDVMERYGIPSKVWLDNGRGFASKMLTGGTKNRFRFKVREDDPTGVLTAMGCEIHWATPYHGQAKPIERAWRDLCDRIAKHPAFAGAYTGNKPDAKPENYGSKAIALDEFVRVVNEEIAAHNAREGRRTRTAAGRSFDAAFQESYSKAPIRKATPEQLRELLLSTDVVIGDRRDGSVRLSGNRYWSEAIAPYAGQKLMLRFDPEQLHQAVQAYTLANVYIGQAECIAAVGFADTGAAREHARAKKNYRTATRKQLDAERRMEVSKVAAQLPAPMPEELPQAGVIAPMFGRRKTQRTEEAERIVQQRTGTDDNQTAFVSLMDRMQSEQQRNSLWSATDGEA